MVDGDLLHHIVVPIIMAFWVLQEIQAALRPTPFTACTGESLVAANPSLLAVRAPPVHEEVCMGCEQLCGVAEMAVLDISLDRARCPLASGTLRASSE